MTFDECAASELPALARYARTLTGDRQHAHDVLAEALVTAHLRWHKIGAMQHPAAYVRRIVTTTFLGEKRRWSTRHVVLTPTGELPEAASPDRAGNVDDRDELRSLLASLPRQVRAAIVMRYYLGLADRDIAAELGCAEVTVRSYISRGIATLQVAGSGGADASADARPGASSANRAAVERRAVR